MTTITEQVELDYMQAAQKRVAADTTLLEKRADVTVMLGATSVTLPVEVLELEAVYIGSNACTLIPTVEYLRIVTGSPILASDTPTSTFYVVIGRDLHIWPAPAAGVTLTLFYTYRPADITSTGSFEFVGYAKRLIERLTTAYMLFDDGQPELGQQELVLYQKDAQRLKRRNAAAQGTGGQLSLAGRRRAPG